MQPHGAITYSNLREYIEAAKKGPPIKLYLAHSSDDDEPIMIFDPTPESSFIGGTLNVFHYPEDEMGSFLLGQDGRLVRSTISDAYIFANYWHAYVHMLRVKAKEAK